jgi:hypothetical protein
MDLASRRAFLQKMAVSFSTMVCADSSRLWAQQALSGTSLRAWITAGEDRYREVNLSTWQPTLSAKSRSGESAVEIDPF